MVLTHVYLYFFRVEDVYFLIEDDRHIHSKLVHQRLNQVLFAHVQKIVRVQVLNCALERFLATPNFTMDVCVFETILLCHILKLVTCDVRPITPASVILYGIYHHPHTCSRSYRREYGGCGRGDPASGGGVRAASPSLGAGGRSSPAAGGRTVRGRARA